MHIAASCGYKDVIDFIGKQDGIRMNPKDKEGNTPLHLAVYFSHYDAVLALLSHGADVSARNNLNQKPIVLSEDETMIKLLAALDTKKSDDDVNGISKNAHIGTISRSTRAKKRERFVKLCVVCCVLCVCV